MTIEELREGQTVQYEIGQGKKGPCGIRSYRSITSTRETVRILSGSSSRAMPLDRLAVQYSLLLPI